MSSPQQISANQSNAEKSTGPTSESGKAVSSANALRHGLAGKTALMPWEDRIVYNEFCADMIADLAPHGPVERNLAQSIADGFWRLNRVPVVECNMFALGRLENDSTPGFEDDGIQVALGAARAFRQYSRDFSNLSIYEQRIQRKVQKDRADLAALQKDRRATREREIMERAKQAPATQPIAASASTPPAAAEPTPTPSATPIGFVCSTSPEPDSSTGSTVAPSAANPSQQPESTPDYPISLAA